MLLTFEENDRVMAIIDPLYHNNEIGTIIKKNYDTFVVKLDKDNFEYEVKERNIVKIREEICTDPSYANGRLVCKNCGWLGTSHNWLIPHFCQEKMKSRRTFETINEEPVQKNSVFEAIVIIPMPLLKK
jgi:hypothetical protein